MCLARVDGWLLAGVCSVSVGVGKKAKTMGFSDFFSEETSRPKATIVGSPTFINSRARGKNRGYDLALGCCHYFP